MNPANRRLAATVLIILVAGTAAGLWMAVQEENLVVCNQLLTQAKQVFVGILAGGVCRLLGVT